VDASVAAELPAFGAGQNELHEIILGSQIHGPCKGRVDTAPCPIDGECLKKYPKEFQNVTEMRDGAYPLYRRRPDSHPAMKGDHPIDNRDVVPYNACFSKRYQAHINVEVVASIKAVKYLYKYTYKGHDRAQVELGVDEIADYVDARYVGPCEACWRLFEFPMAGKSHNIERLDLHLETGFNVVFEPGNEKDALAEAKAKHTTLTAWFELNKQDSFATTLLYREIPEHYRWDRSKRVWIKRRRDHAAAKVIGRIHGASPTEDERYYLYQVALHARGPTSWGALKQINGQPADTWEESAEKPSPHPAVLCQIHRKITRFISSFCRAVFMAVTAKFHSFSIHMRFVC
jgi:hypothetical protein